ncbi:MAG: hypothetical protein HC783_09110, partial [Rhodobacteraceae bacterium]|nr:hypothetical protein [Paracoccaceae bacterium]
DVLPSLRGITPVAATLDDPAAANCIPTLGLEAAPLGMINLSLNAPCNPGERVVMRHAGLSFTAQIRPDGALSLQIPALEPEALVAAYFDSSQIALAKVSVPDATDQIRFAVQMGHPAMFDLRAETDGQVYIGSYGRTADAPRSILPLGVGTVAQPMLAQIYSYPAADTAADLTVEVKITPDTCGRTLPVETLLARGGKVTVTKLAVAVPLCGTSGDILVLKNLLRDLTLAAPR